MQRPAADAVLTSIARYARDATIESPLAYETARYCLLDTLACGFLALAHPACRRVLGPVVPGATLAGGARVPGTSLELDPVQAAFNIGTMNRWLDYNDTWLAAEWGHPSDNLGGILAVADYVSRQALGRGEAGPSVRDVLTAMIKAHEIQGITALENSLNRAGLDHVILVRVATAAVATALLGGSREEIENAVSNAWLDGGTLRTYRQAPNTGTRKSWAAGDATAHGVRHALLARRGEMGYPSALSAREWGFCDVFLGGRPLRYDREFGSYVMENVLFKLSFPAEFHGQTAVECALLLHEAVRARDVPVTRIVIETQQSALRIIDRRGALANPADRDHCLQYMVAIALLHGRLTAADYENDVAADPRVDALRAVMEVRENERFTREYLDPDQRSIGNALQVFFNDGSCTERVEVNFPVGHRRRRAEGIPLLLGKWHSAVTAHFSPAQAGRVLAMCDDPGRLDRLPVRDFVAVLVRND